MGEGGGGFGEGGRRKRSRWRFEGGEGRADEGGGSIIIRIGAREEREAGEGLGRAVAGGSRWRTGISYGIKYNDYMTVMYILY